jgi:hypothetical protein
VSVSHAEFTAWLNKSRPGSICIYHTGELITDRSIDLGPIQLKTALDTVASEAYTAFKDNRVHLFQRKLHDHVYQYIAFKRGYGRSW